MTTGHTEETLYGMLEVSPNATFAEIETAYERIMGYLGVDSIALYSMLDDQEDIDRQRARVEEAFRILGDPQRRAAYDTARLGGDNVADYPSIVVPESRSGASMTLGRFDETDAEPSGTELPLDSDGPSQTAEPESSSAADVAVPPAPEPDVVAKPSSDVDREEPSEPSEPASAVEEPAPPAPTEAPAAALPKILPAGAREKIAGRRLFPDLETLNFTDETEISGSLLRRLRESCDASVAEVAAITKISKRYLRALEENDYGELPAAVYVRGFVREYARALGMDPDAVARGYMSLYERYNTGGD